MRLIDHVDIDAPIDLVWDVYAEVTGWPSWTDSFRRVTLLEGGDGIALGARVETSQPRLPTMQWTVTAFEPGRSWSWVSRSPGAVTTAGHHLTSTGAGTTRVEQTIDQRGPAGALVGRLLARLSRKYLRMEAAGLKATCEALACQP